MPIPFVQPENNESDYTGLVDKLPVTTNEAVTTTFMNELTENALTAKIIDYKKSTDLEAQDDKVLSKEELEQKYQGLNLQWDGPKKAGVAEFIADKQRRQIYNEQKINAGPDTYLASGLKMGASIAAHVADPTELGLTVGSAGLFRAATAARFGVAALESAGLGTRLLMGAGEGAVTQLALEPAEYAFDKQFQRDYKYTDAFKRVAFGAAMGTTIEGLAYGFKSGMSKLEKMRANKAHAVASDVASGQMLRGEPVNVEPVMAAFDKERNPEAFQPSTVVDHSGRTKYAFEPFDTANPGGKKVYLGTQSGMESMQNIGREFHGPEGFTDHPMIANSDAASSFNEVNGLVHEATLSSEAKLISTQTPVGQNEISFLKNAAKDPALADTEIGKALNGFFDEVSKGETTGSTIGELFSNSKALDGFSEDQLFKALEPALYSEGFHGFHIVDNERGINKFDFFDEALKNNGTSDAKLFDGGTPITPDESLVPKLTNEEAMELREKKDSFVPNDEMATDNFQKKYEEIGTIEPDSFEKSLDEGLNDINSQISEYTSDPEYPELKQEVGVIESTYKELKQKQDGFFKAALSCVMKNG